MCIRAVVIANRFASVPEFVNRTRSSPNRAHISSASCRSYGWIPPTLASSRMAPVDGVEYPPLAVPEEPGGVVAEQVDVLVSVRVGQDGPLAADERERERLVVEDRARVPARQHSPGLVVQSRALRVTGGELATLLGDELGC